MVKQDCLENGTLVTAKGRGALGDVYTVVGRIQNEKKKCPKLALRKKTDGSNGVVYGPVIMVLSHRIRRVLVSESLSADEDVAESSMVSDARSVDPTQILVDPEQFLREDLRRFPTPANLVHDLKDGESIPAFRDTPAEARVKVENMVRAVRNLGLKFSPKSPKRKKKSKTKKKRKRKSKKTKKRKKSKKKMKK